MTGRYPVFKKRRAVVEGFEFLQQAELSLLVSVHALRKSNHESLNSWDFHTQSIRESADRGRFESTPTTPHPGPCILIRHCLFGTQIMTLGHDLGGHDLRKYSENTFLFLNKTG